MAVVFMLLGVGYFGYLLKCAALREGGVITGVIMHAECDHIV